MLTVVCMSLASGLWLFQSLVWVLVLAYRNLGSGPRSTAVIERVTREGYANQVLKISVTLKRPWIALPGQYVYITMPGLARHRFTFLQSHPYAIAWDNPGSVKGTIVLLVEQRRGFSTSLRPSKSTVSVIVDGPYGATRTLHEFDKVLFIANGIGIAAHLLALKYLLQAHNAQTARVRRLTLVWFLEVEGESWSVEFR